MNSKKEIVTVDNLVKTYDNGTRALKGVSFKVYQGEFLVVIGLSGSGKSTLLRCLNRLHEPTSGDITFEGERINDFKGKRLKALRANIGMIFQHFNLIQRRSVLTNVLAGSLGRVGTIQSLLGLFGIKERQLALEKLSIVGLEEKVNMRADQLSGGQKQRVAIARTLMQYPKLMLADEPVSSLDPATANSVMQYLEQINREHGVTVICNLHFLSLVRKYATRVIALKDGKVVFEGSPEKIDKEWYAEIYGEAAGQGAFY